MADSALLGAIIGGVIGLSAQLVTALFTRQQQWAEARRVLYSGYLEQISTGRRRLQEQVEQMLQGVQPNAIQNEDRDRIREASIAGWNRVCLVTRSTAFGSNGPSYT